nr:uncharacterized protein LOC111514713 [Leptinotarsa decemlineata]
MGDQWYYNNFNYPSPNIPNYNLQVPLEHNPQISQYSYNQYQNITPYFHHPSNEANIYSTLASYPPPGGPYSVPPPNAIESHTGNSFNCQVQQNHHESQESSLPNDYTRELEKYRFIKSKINEPADDLEKIKSQTRWSANTCL